jgi:hypothetical protein
MIVCFDTSALNQLMDDPEGGRLTSILLRDFDVYITALNIIEIGKTARPDRREQLRAFEKRLSKGFEPLDLPNQLVQRACLAFHNRAEKIIVTLGEASRQLWVTMSEPHRVGDQERSELTRWADGLESSNASANTVLRPELDRIFASNPAARPRTPKQLLRIYMRAGWPVRYRVTAEIYKRATGCILPLSQLDNFLTTQPSIWSLYLGALRPTRYTTELCGEGGSGLGIARVCSTYGQRSTCRSVMCLSLTTAANSALYVCLTLLIAVGLVPTFCVGLNSARPSQEGVSNPYEVPGCQESNVSRQRIFAFFAALLILASLAIGRVS